MTNKNDNWFITGGCGFIGNNLIAMLLERGVAPGNIRIFDNLTTGAVKDLERVIGTISTDADWGGNALSLVEGDIRDTEAARKAAEGANRFVHLAACTGVVPSVEDPLFDCEQNVRGTLNVLEAARHVGARSFVFASSSAPLGMVEPPVHEGLAPNPASPYGASKLAGEGYCLAYYNCFDLPTVALRFGNVYGPYSDKKSSIVAKFIQRGLAGLPLQIYGDGSATRDYIHTHDLCRAILLASDLPAEKSGQIFQIATSAEVSVAEIVDKVVDAFRQRGYENITHEFTKPRQGDVQRNFAVVDKARDVLGWEARIPLDEGILQTLDWQLAQMPR